MGQSLTLKILFLHFSEFFLYILFNSLTIFFLLFFPTSGFWLLVFYLCKLAFFVPSSKIHLTCQLFLLHALLLLWSLRWAVKSSVWSITLAQSKSLWFGLVLCGLLLCWSCGVANMEYKRKKNGKGKNKIYGLCIQAILQRHR